MAVIVSKELKVPELSKKLSDYAHGEIVKLNENGSPVEFYVAKHDYESGLNGAGRTLLVRKDCYDKRLLGSNNAYASSTMNSFLNGTYKNLHDAVVQTAMGTTKFYHTPGDNNFTVTTLSRSIFLLSVTEYGMSHSYVKVEGSALPIASTLQKANLNGSAVTQWTRSPTSAGDGYDHHACIYTDGRVGSDWSYQNEYGSRPAFTLPAEAKFDPDTNEFMEVV